MPCAVYAGRPEKKSADFTLWIIGDPHPSQNNIHRITMRNTANPCKHVQSCESYTVWLPGMYIFILTVHILYEHGMMYLQVCPIEWMRMPDGQSCV